MSLCYLFIILSSWQCPGMSNKVSNSCLFLVSLCLSLSLYISLSIYLSVCQTYPRRPHVGATRPRFYSCPGGRLRWSKFLTWTEMRRGYLDATPRLQPWTRSLGHPARTDRSCLSLLDLPSDRPVTWPSTPTLLAKATRSSRLQGHKTHAALIYLPHILLDSSGVM